VRGGDVTRIAFARRRREEAVDDRGAALGRQVDRQAFRPEVARSSSTSAASLPGSASIC
jgi:hypothetical protein